MSESRLRDDNGQFHTAPADRSSLTIEKTGGQGPEGGHRNASSVVYNRLFPANGGYLGNPMGFPGYDRLYSGSYETYRWMLQHPIIRLVREIAVAPIAASQWRYVKSDPDVPDAWVDMIRRHFNPIRDELLTNFYATGRDYGWAGGEPLWEVRRGETWLAGVKPLLHDVTEILYNKAGKFIGLRNNVPGAQDGTSGFIELSAPYKAFLYTYDSYAGYLYGRSWLENIRATVWKDWLDAAQQMQKLGAKISGIVSIITSPAGVFKDENGEDVSYQENAERVIAGLVEGAAGAWFPSISLSTDEEGNLDALKLMAELAGKSLTKIDVVDFGNHSPAIRGLLDRMIHDEELMFAGGLRPARSGLASGGGTGNKAEAETQSDVGTTNGELDDSRFAFALQPLVNADLEINIGRIARDRVRIEPPPLAPRIAGLLRSILLAVLNQPSPTNELLATMDVDDLLRILGMPTRKKFDAARAAEPAPIPEKPNPTANPQGGRPTVKE